MNYRKQTKKIIICMAVLVVGSIVLGVVFQTLLAVGNFWQGLFSASLLIFLISIVLSLAWLAAGGGKVLAWMIFLAFLLRFALGIFLAWGLPRYGYEERPQQAGFVFEDAFRREENAWSLARSDAPLSLAFSDEYETDQYGGMLALSAMVYRTISLDAYRPALVSILAAGAMALSIPFLMASVRRRLGDRTAMWAGWILVFYPEGVLLGSAQMREPYFILLLSIMFWATLNIVDRNKLKITLPVFSVGAIILFLFSFRMAVPIIGVMLLFIWVDVSSRMEKSWLKTAGWAVILIGTAAGLYFIRDWIDAVLHWDTLQTVRKSGLVQFQLESLPGWLHFPFILIYGLFQPVLPAAIAAPAPWIWRGLGIFRALGWYTLLPVLAYAFIRVWKVKTSRERRWLIVMITITWLWIIIASARAGGDQWDNPRYRANFLPWMAVTAGWAVSFAVQLKDRWLTRMLMVEGIFLTFFTSWYFSRYHPNILRLDFWAMIGLILGLSLVVIAWGWFRDWQQSQKDMQDHHDP